MAGFRDNPDRNRPKIVRELKALGFDVEIIAQPLDILVGAHGHNFMFEIKNPEHRGRKLRFSSEKQKAWWLKPWGGHRDVIFSTEDALAAIEARIGRFSP